VSFITTESDLKKLFIVWAVFEEEQKQHNPKSWILHPGRLTWNLQITHLERNMIFQTSMSMVHVNLPGCTIWFKEKGVKSLW